MYWYFRDRKSIDITDRLSYITHGYLYYGYMYTVAELRIAEQKKIELRLDKKASLVLVEDG